MESSKDDALKKDTRLFTCMSFCTFNLIFLLKITFSGCKGYLRLRKLLKYESCRDIKVESLL